uniref:Uncharacterized protein n=1 Tax=Anguilla anguilla TaxID=7936 RepID=A0A0E9SRH1_ANGAN
MRAMKGSLKSLLMKGIREPAGCCMGNRQGLIPWGTVYWARVEIREHLPVDC